MSGGSYDYLCFEDGAGLFEYEDQLERMIDRLAGLGYADDAARETAEVLLVIRQSKVRIETMAGRMSDVWKAVEWWDSADTSEDHLKAVLDAYRSPDQPPSNV